MILNKHNKNSKKKNLINMAFIIKWLWNMNGHIDLQILQITEENFNKANPVLTEYSNELVHLQLGSRESASPLKDREASHQVG